MKIFNVTEIHEILRSLVIKEFDYPITIKGEIANPRMSPAGHQFFTLRDGNGLHQCSISCVLFKGQSNLIVKEYDSQEVLIVGNVDMYKATGNCQIKVLEISDYGEGALKKAVEKIRLKLEEEGLFKKNKSLPLYPRSIGVVTSPDSHALYDVCSKLKTRYPIANILIYPTLVQGPLAAKSIIRQLNKCNEQNNVDLILLIRGGGSLEDLMAFNDEDLARSIYESKLPIVTGIGHQPDITIADYVSDIAMETPTAAAVKVTPDQFELIQRINNAEEQIKKYYKQKILEKKEALNNITFRFNQYEPSKIIKNLNSACKDIDININKTVKIVLGNLLSNIALEKNRIKQVKKKLASQIVDRKRNNKGIIIEIARKLNGMILDKLSLYKNKNNDLLSYNPGNVLKKGYAILRDKKGNIMKSKDHLLKLQSFSSEFKDGLITIEKIKAK